MSNMKIIPILISLCLLANIAIAEEKPAPVEPVAAAKEGEPGAAANEGEETPKEGDEVVGHCNKALLEAYDIESGWETTKDTNLLCPAVKKLNCCSYHAQMDIFRKWVLKGEKKKIVNTYR